MKIEGVEALKNSADVVEGSSDDATAGISMRPKILMSDKKMRMIVDFVTIEKGPCEN